MGVSKARLGSQLLNGPDVQPWKYLLREFVFSVSPGNHLRHEFRLRYRYQARPQFTSGTQRVSTARPLAGYHQSGWIGVPNYPSPCSCIFFLKLSGRISVHTSLI